MTTTLSDQENVLRDWCTRIPAQEWALHRRVLEEAQERGLRYALGGGLAMWQHSRRWRDTKDMDLFCPPSEKDGLIEVLTELGFADYYEVSPYDRGWIYRAHIGDVITDVIWEMANHCCRVDDSWLGRGPELVADGIRLELLAAEEMIWTKLFVLQRDRCDWPDILNILGRQAAHMDWARMLSLAESALPVLGGVLSVFGWLRPEEARVIPAWAWERVGVRPPSPHERDDPERMHLLDTRDWFGPRD